MITPNYDIIIDKEHNRPLHCPDLVDHLRNEYAKEEVDYDEEDLRDQIFYQLDFVSDVRAFPSVDDHTRWIRAETDRIYAIEIERLNRESLELYETTAKELFGE